MILRRGLLLSCIFTAASVFGQEASQPIVIGESSAIESGILNETRRIYVGKPPSYDRGTDSYGVVYVLDGEAHFRHVVGTTQFLAEGVNQKIPSLLVVAIGNTDRMRDMTPLSQVEREMDTFRTHGGADQFRGFILEELKPWVDEHYRTNGYSALIGHSLSGLFALQAFITQPDTFDSYIVIDPSLWWNDQALVRQAEAFISSDPEINASLYLSVSSEEAPDLEGVRNFVRLLEAKTPDGLRWDLNSIVTESHETIPLVGIYQGLQWLFASWDIEEDAEALFGDAPGQEILEEIDDLYRSSGEELGFERKTPYAVFESLLNHLILNGRLDEAAALSLRHPDRYPLPPYVISGVAAMFIASGNEDAATNYLLTVLETFPGNEAARRTLAEMEVDSPPD